MGNNSTTLVSKAEVIQEANPKLLIDPDDPTKTVTFESLYKGAPGPVIFKFLRRFGCAICREGSAEMCKLKSLLEDKYGKGVITWIGIGLERLGYEQFKEGNFFEGKIYIDEAHELYKTAGFTDLGAIAIVTQLVMSDNVQKVKDADEKGITGDLKGEKSQLGGMLIVSPEGDILFYFRQEKIADEPMKEEVVKAVENYFVVKDKAIV